MRRQTSPMTTDLELWRRRARAPRTLRSALADKSDVITNNKSH